MAHAATLNTLTGELVTAITEHSSTTNSNAFKSCKDAASKNLKNHRYGRTNQFNVQNSLDGLVEKFQILNKEVLAQSLKVRVDRFSQHDYKWKPEVLSLLLLLSDKPGEKADLGNLDRLRPPDVLPPPTWKEIFGDDEVDKGPLWEDVASDLSSSDDSVIEESTASSQRTQDTSLTENLEYTYDNLDMYFVEPNYRAFDSIKQCQTWRYAPSSPESTSITETEALREILHALQGVPSKLFHYDQSRLLHPRFNHYIKHLSSASFEGLLEQFCHMTAGFVSIRKIAANDQYFPVERTLIHAASQALQEVMQYIAPIERSLANPSKTEVASLLGLRNIVEEKSRNLRCLENLLSGMTQNGHDRPYKVIDDLYDMACTAQTIGDTEQYQFFAGILHKCLDTFMRPVYLWMEEGKVQKDLYFVAEADLSADSSLWNNHFVLLQDNGKPRTPGFLCSKVREIFICGKSSAFLRRLFKIGSGPTQHVVDMNSYPSFQDISLDSTDAVFMPYENILDNAFECRIRPTYLKYSLQLREFLSHRCGLIQTVQALHYIYLSRNGAIFQLFADQIFTRIDSGSARWADTSATKYIASSAFAKARPVDDACINVLTDRKLDISKSRTVKNLAAIAIEYRYHWSVQNIIPTQSLRIYRAVMVFLLQIRRATSLLSARRFRQAARLGNMNDEGSEASLVVQYSIRHRLLWFATSLEQYLLYTAVSPSNHELNRTMEQAEDVDAMITAHARFIQSLERKCLLTKELSSVHSALLSILDLAVVFTDLNTSHQTHHQPSASASTSPLLTNDAPEPDSDSEGDEPTYAKESDFQNKNKNEPEKNLSKEEHFQKLHQIQSQYTNLLAIVISGLRNVSHAETGDQSWEQLAEVFEWDGARGKGRAF